MNNAIIINSICVKVCILLSIDVNYQYRIADILYHLALTDFIDNVGEPNSNNIRNINSILHYSKYLNEALLKMQQYNLLIINGEFITKSFSCSTFVNLYKNNTSIKHLCFKIEKAHKLCISSSNVVQLYNHLYDTYLRNKMAEENI